MEANRAAAVCGKCPLTTDEVTSLRSESGTASKRKRRPSLASAPARLSAWESGVARAWAGVGVARCPSGFSQASATSQPATSQWKRAAAVAMAHHHLPPSELSLSASSLLSVLSALTFSTPATRVYLQRSCIEGYGVSRKPPEISDRTNRLPIGQGLFYGNSHLFWVWGGGVALYP
jgi:hypothetical protein